MAGNYLPNNTPFDLLVGTGEVPGISYVFKFGENPDIDTSTDPEDVHSLGGDKLFPTAASTIDIVSTSANDTNGGTGVNTLIIRGLDANYDILEEEITLNGLTTVTSTNSFLRVDRMYATLSGSLQEADGTITATHSEGDIASIVAGESQSLIAAFTVPAGYFFCIKTWFVGIIKKTSAAQCQVNFEVNTFGSNSWRVQQVLPLVAEGTSAVFRNVNAMSFSLPEKTDIRIRVQDVSVNDTGVVSSFDGFLINNSVYVK